jgi:hypothetical protein|tara:strand:- start:181 stop:345 length:165 start_codon:yes stop_codon:yes gene_type:complete
MIHLYPRNEDKLNCFHCGHLIYDLSILCGEKFDGELYCTLCNKSIKENQDIQHA